MNLCMLEHFLFRRNIFSKHHTSTNIWFKAFNHKEGIVSSFPIQVLLRDAAQRKPTVQKRNLIPRPKPSSVPGLPPRKLFSPFCTDTWAQMQNKNRIIIFQQTLTQYFQMDIQVHLQVKLPLVKWCLNVDCACITLPVPTPRLLECRASSCRLFSSFYHWNV